MNRQLCVLALWAGSLFVSPLRAQTTPAPASVPAPAPAPAAPIETPAPVVPAAPPAPRKVVMILIDGVRQRELLGTATDENGKPVRMSEILPNVTALRKTGTFFSRMRISNLAGVSLPGYADIFAGRRQERIVSNAPQAADLRSHYPTLFQAVKKDLGLGFDGVALIAAWAPLCPLAVMPPVAPADDFFRSCGFRNNAVAVAAQPTPDQNQSPAPLPAAPATLPSGAQSSNPIYFKPEIYPQSRADSDTFLEVLQEVPRRHPRLLVVHFVDADEEAHMQMRVQRRINQNYGIFHYHNALRATDYYVGRIWAMLQADPFYKDSTYLVIATDHGRDDVPEPDQWAQHGHCISEFGAKKPCGGCSRVFTVVVGPGVKPQVVKKVYDHTSLGPTIARLLGANFTSATGGVMDELFQ